MIFCALLLGCAGPESAAPSAAATDRDNLTTATTLDNLAVAAQETGDLALAEEHRARALAIRQRLAPESSDLAVNLTHLGIVVRKRGDLDRAEELHQRALALWERLDLENRHVALSLNGLGVVALARGDLARSATFFDRALALRRRLDPGSLDVAASLNNLGVVARVRGDLERAMELYEQSLTIREQQIPGSLDVTQSLNNLGNLAWERGDSGQAGEFHRRSLAIREQLAPDSLSVAASLNNLGVVAQERGDLDRAAECHQRALVIRRQQAPGSLDVTASLINLGVVARARGNLEQAVEFSQQALALQERLAPGGPDAATSLVNLCDLAQAQDDLERAEGFCRRAVEIFERLAPESLDMARSLNAHGRVVLARGALDRALALGERMLGIVRQRAPGSVVEADTLDFLGDVHRRAGHAGKSLELYLRSIEALETQIGKLGGSDQIKAGFRAAHGRKYRGAIELLLASDRPGEAFGVLERRRARSFLTLLAERDLSFGSDIPEELDETRRRLAVVHDQTLSKLVGSNPAEDPERTEALQLELRSLRREYDANALEIRRASPRLAALQYPQPLDLQRARAALDPGTVMLSYSVGEERSDLFVITRDAGLTVTPIPIGEEALRREVEQFRKLIREAEFGIQREERLALAGERLYRKLIEPVADQVEERDRILILPDGPLHVLPFGALVRDRQYLVEWKPLHFALSATVYAELKGTRRSTQEEADSVSLAAFGDPDYPQQLGHRDHGGIPDPQLRSAARQGFDFRPLPASRLEVERIAEIYGGRVKTYLGAAATEERAKGVEPDTRYLHFATHSVLDERFPLESALVLAIPAEFSRDRDNGLLQAWEIFESLRLETDLVVLSACETGLGKELGGEGLIGLTRAFQYAGARSVAASLWAVEDVTTAELMVRFHRHLQEGKAKDEALRAAKIELIRGPVELADGTARHASHPFYWAAFQLQGDWR